VSPLSHWAAAAAEDIAEIDAAFERIKAAQFGYNDIWGLEDEY
jgi:hypothetical protein